MTSKSRGDPASRLRARDGITLPLWLWRQGIRFVVPNSAERMAVRGLDIDNHSELHIDEDVNARRLAQQPKLEAKPFKIDDTINLLRRSHFLTVILFAFFRVDAPPQALAHVVSATSFY